MSSFGMLANWLFCDSPKYYRRLLVLIMLLYSGKSPTHEE